MRPAQQGQEGCGVGCGPGLPRGASASFWGPRSANSTSQEEAGPRVAWGEVLVCTLLSKVCAPFYSSGAEAGPGVSPWEGDQRDQSHSPALAPAPPPGVTSCGSLHSAPHPPHPREGNMSPRLVSPPTAFH